MHDKGGPATTTASFASCGNAAWPPLPITSILTSVVPAKSVPIRHPITPCLHFRVYMEVVKFIRTPFSFEEAEFVGTLSACFLSSASGRKIPDCPSAGGLQNNPIRQVRLSYAYHGRRHAFFPDAAMRTEVLFFINRKSVDIRPVPDCPGRVGSLLLPVSQSSSFGSRIFKNFWSIMPITCMRNACVSTSSSATSGIWCR